MFIQQSQSLLENLFVEVSFDIVAGTTNKSMNGKHCSGMSLGQGSVQETCLKSIIIYAVPIGVASDAEFQVCIKWKFILFLF